MPLEDSDSRYDSWTDSEHNSWTEYRRLVTQTLKDLDQDTKDLTKKVDDMRYKMGIDIAQLKTKAGIWGAIMGFVVSLASSLIIGELMKK